MKKAIKLLSVVCVVALVLACALTANAAVPKPDTTVLVANEAKTAPVIDGKIDASYGEMAWDMKATDHKIGDYNLFPRSEAEFKGDMMAVRNIMRQQGYMAWDSKNFYLAVKCTDTFPLAASDSSVYWNATNIQVCIFSGGSDEVGTPGDSDAYFQTYFTLHWGGINAGKPFALFANEEKRSCLKTADITADKYAVSYEEGTGTLIWEIVIPWDSFVITGVTAEQKMDDFRIGVIQTSMAQGYLCNAFGEAYDLVYGKCVPVEFKAAPVQESTPVSSETTPVSSETTPVSSETTPVSSEDTPDSSEGTDVTSSDSSDVTSSDKTESKDDKTESKDDAKGDVVEEEKDYTAVIVIAIIAAVVIIGGVVAIILINKKKAE